MLQGKIEASCQVLIQLLAPQPASLHRIKQALATILEATAYLASKQIKVCISLNVLPSPDVLAKLAPIIHQLDCTPVGATSEAWDTFSDNHMSGLLRGTHCITSLSLARRESNRFFSASLAKFGNLQQLELHLHDTVGLHHLSGLKGLLQFHLTVTDEGLSASRCGHILDSNMDSLLHVALSANLWDDQTYMALLRLSGLRTFSLQVVTLRHTNAQVLAQLRPSQSMSVTIKKITSAPWVPDMTSCDARITDLTLDGFGEPSGSISVRTMQHLTSLTLVGLSLHMTHIWPQPRLQVLTLSGVRMSSTELEDIVKSCPSVKHLDLSQCLRISPDTLSIILRLKHLITICLSHLEGLSVARLCWMEAFIRAQQCIGMAQPRIHVTCKWGDQTRELCVDYLRYPVLCGCEFDEQRASLDQKCWARVAYPSSRFLCRSLLRVASICQHIAGRASLYARRLAGSRSWAQFDSRQPLGLLVVVAMIGINVACMKMPASCTEDSPYSELLDLVGQSSAACTDIANTNLIDSSDDDQVFGDDHADVDGDHSDDDGPLSWLLRSDDELVLVTILFCHSMVPTQQVQC